MVNKVLQMGGNIHPLIIDASFNDGLGLCNPSIFNDNGELIVNVRSVNYTLLHSENKIIYGNRYGPLAYINPENDVKLKTRNWRVWLDDDFNINRWNIINTSQFDITPVWEFYGLEDARIVKWNERLYWTGVRRDVKTDGQGRMELSLIDEKCNEISRKRIEAPDPNSYCEKNWMPIIDLPYHYIKWTNPLEIVKVDTETNTSEVVISKPLVGQLNNLRGGTQVIPFGKGHLCIIHECKLWYNAAENRNVLYTHRWVLFDKDWNIEHISNTFSFMNGDVEFATGMCEYNGELLITFGFQDNCAFLLRVPVNKVMDLVYDGDRFSWGVLDDVFSNIISNEIFDKNIYQKKVKVLPGDIVVDIGANVGAFSYSILDKKPSKVFCVEPSNTLIETLKHNTKNKCVYINKAISNSNGDATIEDGVHIYSNIGTDYQTITFQQFLKENNIEHIDFMKIDCEGGEYDIFTENNKPFLLNKVKHIVVEFHLWGTKDSLVNFIKFRDLYLKEHNNYSVYNAHNEKDIKPFIWSNTYLERFSLDNKDAAQILIYITNE